MASKEERIRVLEMVRDGIISADQAAQLLEAMDYGAEAKEAESAKKPGVRKNLKGKFFRVRVTDTDTGRARVHVTLPLALVSTAMKTGSKFAPEIDEINLEEIIASIEEGAMGKIVDVYDDDDGEHVEVFIE